MSTARQLDPNPDATPTVAESIDALGWPAAAKDLSLDEYYCPCCDEWIRCRTDESVTGARICVAECGCARGWAQGSTDEAAREALVREVCCGGAS